MPRRISEIAREIQKNWRPVYFGAVPYLEAMSELDTIHDSYGQDSAKSIVNYFLANASKWKGPVAKEIKAELNAMLKGKPYVRNTPSSAKPRPDAMDDVAWVSGLDDADADFLRNRGFRSASSNTAEVGFYALCKALISIDVPKSNPHAAAFMQFQEQAQQIWRKFYTDMPGADRIAAQKLQSQIGKLFTLAGIGEALEMAPGGGSVGAFRDEFENWGRPKVRGRRRPVASLRSKLIRLAHAKPELRPVLLPLLKTAALPYIYQVADVRVPTQSYATVEALTQKHPQKGVATGSHFRPELQGQPTLTGLAGPFYNGVKNGHVVIRYETWNLVNQDLS